MSILYTFLNKATIATSIVAMSIFTVPAVHAAGPINSSINGNNNNVVINNRGGGGRGNYNRGHRRGGSNTGALVTGLVGGAILYSALNSNRHYSNTHVDVRYSYGHPAYRYNHPRYRYSHPRYRYYGAPRTSVVYVERPTTVVREVPVYTQAPVYNTQPSYVPQQPQMQNSSCLQTREYTSTVNVGGEAVPAYGQACLQPDGSWKFGEATPVPSF